MKKNDEIHANDLLDQLRKHVETPQIVQKAPEEEEDSQTQQAGSPLEKLFGHDALRRRGNGPRMVTKAKPIPPTRRKTESDSPDPTKARIDETEYDLKAIFGIKGDKDEEKVERKQPVSREPKAKRKVDPYDSLSVKEKKSIAADYRKQLRLQRVGIALLLVMMFLVLIWENTAFFGIKLPDYLNAQRYPVVNGWIAIEWMVLSILLLPETFRTKRKSERVGAPRRIFAVMVIVHTLYVLFRIVFLPNDPMISFCLPVLFCGLLAKFCTYGAIKREYLAFCVAFSSKEKYTLRMLEGDEAALEREELRDHLPESTRFFAVERISSVLGFHREINMPGSVKRPVRLLVPASVLLGVCFGLLGWSITHSLSDALAVGMSGYLLTMPISLLYVFYAPMTSLAKGAHQSNAAVMGERAMDEYAPPAVVTFSDAEVFPPEQVSLMGVKVFDDADMAKVIGYASAIFCATGGALGEMFSLVVSDTGYTADMDFITVSEDGLEAAVDGELVMVGTRNYLRQRGVKVPLDKRDLHTDEAVMYMAISRKAVGRMELVYEMADDFEEIAQNLFRAGICVAIKTFDPNINREFLERQIRWSGDMPLKIVRGKEKKDRILHRDSAESLLLSSTKRGLFEALKACRTTRTLMQIGVILAGLSMLATIPVFWLVLKMLGVDEVTSLNVFVYQLIWLLPMFGITKLFG
jgi:hypothetical protein